MWPGPGTCLLLIEKGKIADALGLSRSLLEHYLLLMLMSRGRKYPKLGISSRRELRAALRDRRAPGQASSRSPPGAVSRGDLVHGELG